MKCENVIANVELWDFISSGFNSVALPWPFDLVLPFWIGDSA